MKTGFAVRANPVISTPCQLPANMTTGHVRLIPIREEHFNSRAVLPFGLRLGDIRATLEDTHRFVHSLNEMMHQHIGQRIEDVLTPATFSGMLSELCGNYPNIVLR